MWVKGKRVTKLAMIVRVTRNVRRAVRKIKEQKVDGITYILLEEHNVDFRERSQWEGIAEAVARVFRRKGFYADVDAREIEQMGGQHMEAIARVALTIVTKEAISRNDSWSNLRILNC